VQEVTPAGELVWAWNTKDHIALTESARWCDDTSYAPAPAAGRDGYDVAHVNSVEETAGGDLIVSLRHTDAIYRIDRATGDVEWKLGGTTRRESLDVLGDDAHGAATFGGQHDARELPDGTVTVFDNRSLRGQPPRAVRFAIDAAARTATLVEDLRDPGAGSSFCCGGTRRLPGGNWVTSWGGLPLVTEHTATGERVFALEFDDAYSYRADPVRPGALSREALRAGMDTMHPR
jgi:Arylsulfotransferase (ASST)